MFKSKVREVNFSQYEHGRLAGTLARHWGNEEFARPELNFEAFADGVTLHDWGYGVLDNLPIGEMDDEAWLQVVRKGIDKIYDHPDTTIIVRLHIRRLLTLNPSPERQAYIDEIDARIASQLNAAVELDPESIHSHRERYERADKITQLCDMISFDFCFESPRRRSIEVYADPSATATTAITYKIRPGGEVRVEPWPFSVAELSGILYAFRRANYPQRLDPVIVPYVIRHGQ
jgi:hypothetical protein